jgi:hypothetical protein
MSVVLSIKAQKTGQRPGTYHCSRGIFLVREGLRFIPKRVEHDATGCNEGTHRHAHLLPDQLTKSHGVHLQRDQLEHLFPSLQNVYSQPERKDDKTGEIRPASLHAQILAENVTQSGETKLEMVTLKVHTEDFRSLVGQKVRVPVGAFVANGGIMFYALRNEAQPLAGA